MVKKVEEKKIEDIHKPLLLEKYKEARVYMAKEKKKNLLAIPRITKIVVSSCLGDYFRDKKKFESIKEDIRKVTLQEPITIKAKKSVSTYSLREGMDIAYKSTLRKNRMFYFMHRLIYCGWINDRNFNGISSKSIAGNVKSGYNLNIGLKDISIFPEVQKTLDKYIGIGITICTTAKTPEECQELLEHLDLPFINSIKEKKEK